jgi:HAE1 family hydrophobic/amphiphilic exporter-1
MGQGVAGRPTVNGGLAFVYLVDRSKRPHQREVMEMMRRELGKIKDIRVSVESAGIIGPAGGRQVDLQYVIKGPDIEELQRISERLIAEFGGKPGYRDVDTDLRLNEPQVYVKVNREKLADLGLSVEQVSNTLNVLFGKFQLGTYELGSESYKLYVKAVPEFVQNIENLKKVYLKNFRGELVPLTEVVEVQEATGYQVLNRYNRQYSFSFFANLSGEKSLADAVAELEEWLRD